MRPASLRHNGDHRNASQRAQSTHSTDHYTKQIQNRRRHRAAVPHRKIEMCMRFTAEAQTLYSRWTTSATPFDPHSFSKERLHSGPHHITISVLWL
jgi:hypothetical protein